MGKKLLIIPLPRYLLGHLFAEQDLVFMVDYLKEIKSMGVFSKKSIDSKDAPRLVAVSERGKSEPRIIVAPGERGATLDR